jgi:hypothetical protein
MREVQHQIQKKRSEWMKEELSEELGILMT